MGSHADVIVLGAGMVGVSVVLHLRKRGRDVALVDRREAGEETSYGNAGLIQREAVIPYTFPQDFGTILSYAMNNHRDAVYHLSALPRLARWLLRYWQNATPERVKHSVQALAPLMARWTKCLNREGVRRYRLDRPRGQPAVHRRAIARVLRSRWAAHLRRPGRLGNAAPTSSRTSYGGSSRLRPTGCRSMSRRRARPGSGRGWCSPGSIGFGPNSLSRSNT
jgi:glycine/D-amino acid oxidase-like deaminating enzyme